MVSLPTSSDEEYDCGETPFEEDYDCGQTPFEEEHKGFPETCFCGADAILEMKQTGQDAGRLYYRCSSYMDNTVHLGKWFDEAVQEECQIMRNDIDRLKFRDTVDSDYIQRVCDLETSHEKMKVTVSWLAEEVKGWGDECKLLGVAAMEKQKARKRLWARMVNILTLRTNRANVGIAVALVASFILGWKSRDFF